MEYFIKTVASVTGGQMTALTGIFLKTGKNIQAMEKMHQAQNFLITENMHHGGMMTDLTGTFLKTEKNLQAMIKMHQAIIIL